ncbi:small, acid-soluble spore protein, alpha/beta type [Bacillus sp. FSL K6-0268]|uniref:small, acid-soluble spore protein, alpha/beta type n=1 Tax=Bacillus sp. FSL K6-0268 TaxID=2921449 RepID=UPI0030F56B6B
MTRKNNPKPWLHWMKEDIARELGVTLGANATAHANGAVGGEITKRSVAISLQHLSRVSPTQTNISMEKIQRELI